MPNEPKILSRAAAEALGLKKYFTGKPCRRGHVAERYVSACRCIVCLDIANAGRVAYQDEYQKEYRKTPARAASSAKYYNSAKGRENRLRGQKRVTPILRKKYTIKYKSSEKGKSASRISSSRRRAIERASPGGFSINDYRKLVAQQKKCHICHKPFRNSDPATIDHVIALADGGAHDAGNIALAHGSCNRIKHARRTHLI